ncbi:MAG TPA: hypothetical protein VMZ92_21985 [Planctomycetota bacterium]|nr:hypothetical protein [Planctomycetota bacterium]
MKTRTWVCVLTVLVGCGGGGGGATPKATFEKYKAAMADKNFEDVWNMLASTSQQAMDDRARTLADAAAKSEGPGRTALEDQARMMRLSLDQMKKLTGKTLFMGLFEMASSAGKEEWEKISRAQFSREVVTGDKAKVYVKVDGKEETDAMPLVREGNRWKIDLQHEG